MSDAEFDAKMDVLKAAVPPAEYDSFRNSMHEGAIGYGVKRRHPYIMGSLTKIKSTEPDVLGKFLKKYGGESVSVSAKVDGISCRLSYSDGRLVQAVTRGDGYEGFDVTDKAAYVNGILKELPGKETIDLRGELVILTGVDLGTETNPRNVCAGIMNRKDWLPDDVRKISFVAYTVLGGDLTKAEQFERLEKLGFDVAWHTSMKPSEMNAETLVSVAKAKHPYECDGLVLMGDSSKNEAEYRPKNAMAFKINELRGTSRVINVSWDGPSKDGFFCPVAVVEGVEIGGAEIRRATLHNLDIMKALGVKYGDEVEIVKSGDIIPQVVSVIRSGPKTSKPIVLPDECPCCGSVLVRDGDSMRCVNPDCRAQKVGKMEHFTEKLDVANAAFKTLDALGIDSFESLLSFKADPSKKSQTRFEKELSDKVFSRSERELFCAVNIRDVGSKLLNRIIDFYGWDRIKESASLPDPKSAYEGLPYGIGEATMSKFFASFKDSLAAVEKIKADVRYRGASVEAPKAAYKGSVCFTGSLATMGRKEASALAEKAGYEVKTSVSKGLTYLVTNTPDSGSSKNRKAQAFGTKIIDETQFLALIDDKQADISEL